ncbi:MAG: helix-turn-helix transcriptional regulator [Clostridia bacterium]|nr:helix-turn-helix transcriptional regulator [Clostridia bacterium]
MEMLKTLGKRIRAAREKKYLTREQLAEAVELAPYYLGEIERDVKTPSLPVFVKLCEALGVSADYLLRDELPSGGEHVATDMEKKLSKLNAKQRIAAEAILDAYIKTL